MFSWKMMVLVISVGYGWILFCCPIRPTYLLWQLFSLLVRECSRSMHSDQRSWPSISFVSGLNIPERSLRSSFCHHYPFVQDTHKLSPFPGANDRNCFLGDRCQSYAKGVGLTLDDILRYEIKSNNTLVGQSLTVKVSAALTMIFFVAGLINSGLSLLTFQNRETRQVGTGIYLLTSSVTSFLTISMFTINFWFFVLTRTNPSVSRSILHGGCVIIEPALKLVLYLDNWLNACVAVERAIAVSRGVKFDKQRSKRIARWILLVLPFTLVASIIHEPLHRQLFDDREMQSVWCVTRYSSSLQHYNTIILFFHFLGPFAANLFSALFIIFGTVRRRSRIQVGHSYIEQLRQQLSEHKQLLISPMVLVLLSLPRLIISLISGCVDVSRHAWLYLLGYFISFIPSVMIFVVFVLPSGLYKRQFRQSTKQWRRRLYRSWTFALSLFSATARTNKYLHQKKNEMTLISEKKRDKFFSNTTPIRLITRQSKYTLWCERTITLASIFAQKETRNGRSRRTLVASNHLTVVSGRMLEFDQFEFQYIGTASTVNPSGGRTICYWSTMKCDSKLFWLVTSSRFGDDRLTIKQFDLYSKYVYNATIWSTPLNFFKEQFDVC